MNYHGNRFEQPMKPDKKGGRGRANFLQERSEDLCCRTSVYKKFLLQNNSKELQNLNGAHCLTAPVIHQMKEFVGDHFNQDADLNFLKTEPPVIFDDVNDAISYTASSYGSNSKSSSISSSLSTSDVKEYEDLCKSLKAYHIKSKVKRCDDSLELRNRDIEINYCTDWDWKPQDFEDSEFILKPEEFPSLK